MDQFSIASTCGRYERDVWLLRGPDEPHPLCLFLDGEFYIEKVGVLPLLQSLFEQPEIPRMTCLFVSYKSARARQEEYTCNDGYAAYIAKDVVQWAHRQVPSLQSDGHILCGISLSGLCSAYTTVQYPSVFSHSLCQSGSFWWNGEWFAEMIAQRAPLSSRFWLSVGDLETDTNVSHPPLMFQEMSQVEGVTKAAASLRNAGGQVHHNTYHGGHEFGPWNEEFTEAMHWLLERS